ncbi:MAG: DNA repair protein RecN [Nevskiales bacterium]|nr:DNA repair protein RecN [Nevskiales bacterium]
MLRTLHIKNFAIIDALDLEFSAGFSVLSGETGTGKSILIDALGLLLGDRAEAAQVRNGTAQADIAAEFSLQTVPAARAWLAKQAMEDTDNSETCLLRRVISNDGRSRAFINGTTASLGNLRELGERLVEIHGQNEHQSLLRTDTQRELLDDFGSPATVLASVAAAARKCAEIDAEIERLRTASNSDPAQLDYLRFQLQELEALQLQDGELEQITANHQRLANAGLLLQEGGQSQDLLYGGENSLHDQLAGVRNRLARLAQLDPAFGTGEALINEAQMQIQEAADTVRRALDRLNLDPSRLAEVERRLEAIHDLARKHRIKPDQLPERLRTLQNDLRSIENAAGDLEKLEVERQAALQNYRKAAEKLTHARTKAARELSTRVTTVIHELGMPKAKFSVALHTIPQNPPRTWGDEEVRFDLAANPGQPLRPLNKVASGGELSRLALAVQLIANQNHSAATLIFDEVDAGVGGGTAEIVGTKLRELAGKRQVLCVTHLPQVAAQGHQHYGIRKELHAGNTLTRVERLSTGGRVSELARMLGGHAVTAQAHAEELLKRSRETT